MKRIFISCFLLLSSYFLLPTSSAATKIGYIDSKRILAEYKGSKELTDELQKQLKLWENQAIKKKKEIEELVSELESQSLILTTTAREQKKIEIEQKQRDYEQFIQNIYGTEGKAQAKQQDIMKPFIDEVNTILTTIGEKDGYTIIFDISSMGVVYAKPGLDLTDKVLDKLNKGFVSPEEVSEEIEKALFFVFDFIEKTTDAKDNNDGRRFQGFIKAALVKTDKFKAIKQYKIGDAEKMASIEKKTEDYTLSDYCRIAQFTDAKFIVIGEVSRLGENIDLTCELIDIVKRQAIAKGSGSTAGDRIEDHQTMVGNIVSKLMQAIK